MDIYQTVTDKIVTAIESGDIPWLKPWKGQAGCTFEPHNAVTGRAYNGINMLILGCATYAHNGWLTYKQAQALGGNVAKGQKGTMVVYWQFNKAKDASGQEKIIPFAKAYTVFNVEQCENLDMGKIKQPIPPVAGQTDVNAIAQAHGVKLFHGGDKACFIPSQDKVLMPSAADFRNIDAYQSTLAHELTHWTGHENRLKRDFSGRFGSAAYAFEELVAEIGSAFVCARLGVAMSELHHSAAYLQSWLKVLKEDKRAIFTASSKARQAAEYLIPSETVELEGAEA